jgi:hypothetical protein
VQKKRFCISPNEGFAQQLQVQMRLNFSISIEQKELKKNSDEITSKTF